MRLGGRYVGDQRGLPVRRLLHGDAELFAQPGTAAIGEDRQLAIELRLVVEGKPVTALPGFQGLHFGRAVPAHHLGVERLPQALAEPGVLHHVAQRRHAFLDGGQAGGAEAAAVGNMDMQDRLGALGDRRPQAEALVDLPAAIGQRRGTGVVAGLVGIAGREGFDQHDRPATLAGAGLQGQGQRRADQAAADDRQVGLAHGHLRPPRSSPRPSAPRSRRRSWVRRWSALRSHCG
ncbi:Uncharacterised protein [Pseudomonas aeruginosa]|nr:Uncharacterised protein [Pseudomonas aeruginosa]